MILEITPLPKPRMTQRNTWYKPPALQRYWDYVNTLKLMLPGYELPDELRISFIMPMPKSWPAKKKALMFGKPHQNKPDIDNLVKGFTDGLASKEKGDQHVHTVIADKKWGNTGYIRLYTDNFVTKEDE